MKAQESQLSCTYSWQQTCTSYSQAGCYSQGQIGAYPSAPCDASNHGEVQVFRGCEQGIDWYEEYTCECQ